MKNFYIFTSGSGSGTKGFFSCNRSLKAYSEHNKGQNNIVTSAVSREKPRSRVKAILFVMLIVILFTTKASWGQPVSGFYYQSRGSGPWESPSTWWESSGEGGAWVPSLTAPGYCQGIEILPGHIITVNSGIVTNSILLQPGGEIIVNPAQTLTLDKVDNTSYSMIRGKIFNQGAIITNDILLFLEGSIYEHGYTTAMGVIPSSYWSTGSTCLINRYTTASGIPAGYDQAFANFTWNCPNQSSVISLDGQLQNVTGNLTIESTGTSYLILSDNNDLTLNIDGNLSVTGGIMQMGTSVPASTTINLHGGFYMSGGLLRTGTGSSSCNVNFVSRYGSPISKTGGSITGTSTCPVNFTIASGASIDFGTSVLDGSYTTFTLADGGTIMTGSPDGIASSGATGAIQVDGLRSYSTGASYVFNGATNQTAGNGLPATVRNLTISNTGSSGDDAVTLIQNTNITGNFSITGGNLQSASGPLSINFAGTSAQTFSKTGGTIGSTGHSLAFIINPGATVDFGTSVLDGTNTTFSLNDGATLITAHTDGIASSGLMGTVQVDGTRTFSPGANYIYNAYLDQNTGNGLPQGLTGNITIEKWGPGGSNTVTLNSPVTIADGGSITIFYGVFNIGTNLTMNATTVPGTINRTVGGSMSGVLQGTGRYNLNYYSPSGDYYTNIITGPEIAGSGLNNVLINMALYSQTLTLNQPCTPVGDLTINVGTLDLGNYTIGRSAEGGVLTIANNGVLRIGGTNSLPLNYTTHTIDYGSIVEYNGATQTVSPETYSTLITSGSGTKNIAPGTAVTVEYNLTTNDLLTIESTSTINSGSLIAPYPTGNVTYNRQLLAGPNGNRHFFSSPVGSNTATNSGKIAQVWEWDELTGTWPLTSMTGLASGRGYNLEQTLSSDGLMAFTGPVVNSATIIASSPYETGYTDRSSLEAYSVNALWAPGRSWTNYGGGGWNLLGNPFTSAMNAVSFINANLGSFDPNYQALYIYDGTTDQYKYVAATVPGYPESGLFGYNNNIQAGQGFFVLALYDGVAFNFNSDMQVHNTTVPMTKSGAAEDPWPGIQLKLKYGNNESLTTIVYNEKMTAGLDPGYDVGQYSGGPDVEIYTALAEKANGVNFVRQALPLADAEKNIVPVGIDSEKGGEVIFSAAIVPLGDKKFYLEDRKTGTFTDLGTKNYTVTIPANTSGTGRFYLHASINELTGIKPPQEDPNLPEVRVWTFQNQVVVKGVVSNKATSEVYDLYGRKIFETRLAGGEYNTFTLPAEVRGVCMVIVKDGTKVIRSKVVFL